MKFFDNIRYYEVLSVPEKQEVYDQYGEDALKDAIPVYWRGRLSQFGEFAAMAGSDSHEMRAVVFLLLNVLANYFSSVLQQQPIEEVQSHLCAPNRRTCEYTAIALSVYAVKRVKSEESQSEKSSALNVNRGVHMKLSLAGDSVTPLPPPENAHVAVVSAKRG
ncbi:hypothetical protein Tco_1144989 [Tanacetum coccineum]